MLNFKKAIGTSIRNRRKELLLDLDALSIHSGVTPSTLSSIENGKANSTLDTLEKICSILGLSLELKIKER